MSSSNFTNLCRSLLASWKWNLKLLHLFWYSGLHRHSLILLSKTTVLAKRLINLDINMSCIMISLTTLVNSFPLYNYMVSAANSLFVSYCHIILKLFYSVSILSIYPYVLYYYVQNNLTHLLITLAIFYIHPKFEVGVCSYRSWWDEYSRGFKFYIGLVFVNIWTFENRFLRCTIAKYPSIYVPITKSII